MWYIRIYIYIYIYIYILLFPYHELPSCTVFFFIIINAPTFVFHTGNIIRADVLLDTHTSRSKGQGTVLFETSNEAQKAISTS